MGFNFMKWLHSLLIGIAGYVLPQVIDLFVTGELSAAFYAPIAVAALTIIARILGIGVAKLPDGRTTAGGTP